MRAKTKLFISTAMFFLTLALSLTACTPDNDSRVNTPDKRDNQSNIIQIIDDSGEPVTLNKPAQRVIALAPHIVENVYSAGAGDLLIARVNYANFPPEATTLPKVGGYNQFNIEAIADLKPDLILAWESGTPEHFITKLRQLGIPLYLDEPSTISEVARSIRHIGKLTGRYDHAEKVAQQHLKDLTKIEESQKHKTPITVFYQVWDDPIYTINGKQIISDVLRLCGGINIYASEPIKAPIISLESLIERNPEVIITGDTHTSIDEALGKWKSWPSIRAVKNSNLFVVNADIVSRHSIRILQGAESICEKLDQARTHLTLRQ